MTEISEEISEEEEQALLEVQLDNMALEEQSTVAASTTDILMRQLQALQNQMKKLLEQQRQQPQQQQQQQSQPQQQQQPQPQPQPQQQKKKRPRRNPYQRRRGRGRGRGGLNIYYYN